MFTWYVFNTFVKSRRIKATTGSCYWTVLFVEYRNNCQSPPQLHTCKATCDLQVLLWLVASASDETSQLWVERIVLRRNIDVQLHIPQSVSYLNFFPFFLPLANFFFLLGILISWLSASSSKGLFFFSWISLSSWVEKSNASVRRYSLSKTFKSQTFQGGLYRGNIEELTRVPCVQGNTETE